MTTDIVEQAAKLIKLHNSGRKADRLSAESLRRCMAVVEMAANR